jgi:hypothetical protein
VTIVKVRCRRKCDEELTAVGVWAPVRHRQDARLAMPQLRMELVCESVPGSANALSERIAALDHEALDDSMKNNPVVVRLAYFPVRPGIGPFPGAFGKLHEVLDGFWSFLIEQANREFSFGRIECGERRQIVISTVHFVEWPSNARPDRSKRRISPRLREGAPAAAR